MGGFGAAAPSAHDGGSLGLSRPQTIICVHIAEVFVVFLASAVLCMFISVK